MRKRYIAVLMCLISVLAWSTPVKHVRTVSNIDWTSAGIAGVGGGSGTINLTTLQGAKPIVKQAFLYWHGINNSGPGAIYDNPVVTINGHSVTGVSLGDASTNCWGDGSSRAFEADVTAFVPGNGTYTIAGMSSQPGFNANGASIVVIYDDGNPNNNRDLVFFLGNDSNIPVAAFPDDAAGWNAVLTPIAYRGGAARAEFHVADGQDFTDGPITFATANGSLTIPDSPTLWDGISLPSAGTSRAANGGLWDIENFDISAAFGATPGNATLSLTGMVGTNDCLGLVALLLDLEPNSAPPPPGQFSAFNEEVELRPARNQFEVEGWFTLGPVNNGLNFATDETTFTVGTTVFDFAKNTLHANTSGVFSFEGMVNQQKVEISITPSATVPGKFSFELEGQGDPTGGSNPVTVSLVIGDDHGTTKAKVTTRFN